MRNANQPIYPSMYTRVGEGEDDFIPLKDGKKTDFEIKFGGLTKRELFAKDIFCALIAQQNMNVTYEDDIDRSIELTDKLLKALES